jgi:hypothetical protein
VVGEKVMADQHHDVDSGAERRQHERSTLLYSCSLYDGENTVDCVIKDISASGARLMVEKRLAAQQEFILDIDGVGLFPSRIVWQSGDHAGIRFLNDTSQVKSWISSAWGK